MRILDEQQLHSAFATVDQWGQRLTQAILNLRFTSEDVLVNAIAQIAQCQKVSFVDRGPDPAALPYLDAATCRKFGVFPVAITDQGKTLHLGMVDPMNLELTDHISAHRHVRVKPYAIGENTVEKAVLKYYQGQSNISFAQAAEEKPVAEMDELKLVDSTGRTMMVANAVVSLKPPAPTAPVAAPPPPPAPQLQARAPAPHPSQPHGVQPHSNAELERELAQIKQVLAHTEQLARVLAELLTEKRVLSIEEVRARFAAPRR